MMPGLLYWIQVVGGMLSVLLAAGALLAGAYTTLRDTPKFWKRITGYKDVQNSLEGLRADHKVSQELQLQQAEEFNHLSEAVCEQHDIPDGEQPKMNTLKIRRELLGRDETDFTRGRSSDD